MTTESKFDHKWMENLTAYVDYIKKNYRFPTNTTTYQGHKIGCWIKNQKNAKRNGCLTEDRERLLDYFIPPWDKNCMEKKQYLNDIVKRNWMLYIPSEQHSLLNIERFAEENDLLQLHFLGIHTCEEYIDFLVKKNTSKEKLCSVYSGIYPFLTTASAIFLCVLFDIQYNDLSKPEKMETFFLQFPYSTINETEERIRKLLSKLSKQQRVIVEKRLGICDAPMTYQSLSEEFRVTKEAVRQRYIKAISYLKKPKLKKILLMTETDLDLYFLSPLTKGILYRNNICTTKQINELCLEDKKLEILPCCPLYRKCVIEEITHNLKINKNDITPLDTYHLSFRSYNALRRFGISTYGELLEYCGKEPEEKLLRISGLGKGSVREICQKLCMPRKA